MELKSRRSFLTAVGGVGTLALAGCTDGGSSTAVNYGGAEVDGDGRSFWATLELENEGEEEETVELSSTLQIGVDGVYGTHRNEMDVTIPGGETVTEELVLADRTRLSEAEDNELSSGYMSFEILLDGSEVEQVERGDAPSQHNSFRVLYGRSWQGAVGGEGSTRNIQGSGDRHLPVSDDAFIVSGNAQKQDRGSDEIIVQVIVDGSVIAEEATTSEFGVAQVAAESGDSPLESPRVPYEPQEVMLSGTSSTGGDSNGSGAVDGDLDGDMAVSIVRRYYTALDRQDVETVNELSHPDSLDRPFTADEVAVFEDYEIVVESAELVSIDESSATVDVVLTLIAADAEETGDETIQLRPHQGEWRIWH